jgi:hypothetical protein
MEKRSKTHSGGDEKRGRKKAQPRPGRPRLSFDFGCPSLVACSEAVPRPPEVPSERVA